MAAVVAVGDGQIKIAVYVTSLIVSDLTLIWREAGKKRKSTSVQSGCKGFQTFGISMRGFSQLEL